MSIIVGIGVTDDDIGAVDGHGGAVTEVVSQTIGIGGAAGKVDGAAGDTDCEGGMRTGSLPAAEAVKDDAAHGGTDGLCRCIVEGGSKGNVFGVAVEEHHIERAGCGIGAGDGRVALVALVQFNVGVVGAEVAPHSAYGTERCVVCLGHVGITLAKHAVHAFVGTQYGEVGRVLLVAVLAAPGHVEHGLGTGIVGVDGVY